MNRIKNWIRNKLIEFLGIDRLINLFDKHIDNNDNTFKELRNLTYNLNNNTRKDLGNQISHFQESVNTLHNTVENVVHIGTDVYMKVESTEWYWITKEENIRHLSRIINQGLIQMSIIESFGRFRLAIGHSFKFHGNTYYDLKSKDIVSLCNEADDIAREEFTRMAEWYTDLIKELGDN